MRTVGTNEAKAHLSQLIDDVADGEEVTITRRGKPVALLLSPILADKKKNKVDLGALIERILKIRKGSRLDGLSLEEMRSHGRR